MEEQKAKSESDDPSVSAKEKVQAAKRTDGDARAFFNTDLDDMLKTE